MDVLQQSRRKFFWNNVIDKGSKGIEIGPFNRPTVYQTEAEMYYADYYTTDELRSQGSNYGIPPEDIPPVDFVLKSKELHEQLGNEEFDFIIANHVLEHVVDPFRWLKNLEPALKNNGRFIIALPDKRFSFDKFRTDTSLSHFISDYLNGGEKTIEQHAIEAAIYYDNRYVNGSNDITQRLHSDFIQSARSSYHPGMHVHVFQAEVFLKHVLKPFLNIGWLNLSLEKFGFNVELGEFYFSLYKTDSHKVLVTPEEFFINAYDTQQTTH